MCPILLAVEPGSLEARKLPATNTWDTRTLIRGSWWPRGEYLPCLFFFCSSSRPGTPGIPRKVLCEFPYHTSSSWSGGIIYREESKMMLRGQRSQGESRGVCTSPTPTLRLPPPAAGRQMTCACPGDVDPVSALRKPHEASPASSTDTEGPGMLCPPLCFPPPAQAFSPSPSQSCRPAT